MSCPETEQCYWRNNEDQVGYIKGRRVSTLILLIDDVTEQLTVQQKPGLLFTVHYSQAFDRISKDCKLRVFERNGFGPDFLQWVRVPMSDTKSCMNYCWWLSAFLCECVDSGICQGCPFPPLAFVLAIELLAIKRRDMQNIKGIRNWSWNNVPYI